MLAKPKEIVTAWVRSLRATPEQRAEAERRLAICAECPARRVRLGVPTCAKCGCPISKKVYSPSVDACPLRKWRIVPPRATEPAGALELIQVRPSMVGGRTTMIEVWRDDARHGWWRPKDGDGAVPLAHLPAGQCAACREEAAKHGCGCHKRTA